MPKFPLHPSHLLSALRNASHQKSATWKAFLSPLQGSEGDPRDSLYTPLLSAQQVDWPRRTWVLTKGRRVQAFTVWFLHSGDFLEPRRWLKDDPDAHLFTELTGESGTISEENRASFLFPDCTAKPSPADILQPCWVSIFLRFTLNLSATYFLS